MTPFFGLLNFVNSIKGRLIILFSLLLCIICFIVVSFFWYEAERNNLAYITGTLKQVNYSLKEASILEKDFLAFDVSNPEFYTRKKSIYLEKHQELAQDIRNNLIYISDLDEFKSTVTARKLKLIATDVDMHHTLFDSLVHLKLLRGFKEFGVIGKFRSAIHQIEYSPVKFNRAKMLMIRRHEKDYLLRQQLNYVTKHRTAIDIFNLDVITTNADVADKSELLYQLSVYSDNFSRMLEIDKQIGYGVNEGLYGELTALHETITHSLDSETNDIEQITSLKGKYIRWKFMSVVLLGVGLTVILIVFVYRKLGAPISRLSSSIRDVISSDFAKSKVVYAHKSKDEIGTLASDFEHMLDKVQQRTSQVISQKEEIADAFQNVKLLSEIGKDVIAHLNTAEIAQTVYDNINSLLDARVLAIGIFDEQKNGIDLWTIGAKMQSVRLGFDSCNNSNLLSVWCFKHNREVIINNYEEEYGSYIPNAALPSLGVKQSVVYVPLVSHDTKIGVLSVQSSQANAYTDNQLNILRNLAIYVSIAIQNSQSYRKIEEQKEEILQNSKKLEHAYNNLEHLVTIRTQEIVLQKEEIQQQANTLEITNKELEKLSIVAEQTDNAVIIMDSEGRFEWVNDGFTRMFGYTLNELIGNVSDNIVGANSDPETQKLILSAIEEQKTVVYDTLIKKSGTGTEFWVQTTLSPILDKNGLMKKMVAIDTNIDSIKKAEAKIIEQNRNITDSIQYACKIQRAVLPPEELVSSYLPENFVFYKPKHIVSGDFYWVRSKQNKIILAAGDCTGHGVPGGFMSMLGVSLLNRVANKPGVQHANQMLNELRKYLKSSLRQTGRNDEAKDGMDLSLCIIDFEKMTLEFSGAYNPVYIIRDGNVLSLKADRMPIGIFIKERESFTNHLVNITHNDVLYMFTDGYVDQFSEMHNRKFSRERFRQLLLSIHKKPFAEQKMLIERNLETWSGSYKQVDDVLVMGFRLKPNLETNTRDANKFAASLN